MTCNGSIGRARNVLAFLHPGAAVHPVASSGPCAPATRPVPDDRDRRTRSSAESATRPRQRLLAEHASELDPGRATADPEAGQRQPARPAGAARRLGRPRAPGRLAGSPPCRPAWSAHSPAVSADLPAWPPGTRCWSRRSTRSLTSPRSWPAARGSPARTRPRGAGSRRSTCGLLRRSPEPQIQFRHPLVRSGVLQAETLHPPPGRARRPGRSLTDDPYRRTWHRAQSIVGPDDEVADELEANVGLALARGAVLSAIADLQRSAQLTSSSTRRGHRLLKAAEHAFGLGAPTWWASWSRRPPPPTCPSLTRPGCSGCGRSLTTECPVTLPASPSCARSPAGQRRPATVTSR